MVQYLKFDGYLRLYSPYEKQKDEILPELIEQEILESQILKKHNILQNHLLVIVKQN